MANNLLPSLAMGIRRDGNQSSGLAGWLTEDQENQSNWDESQIYPNISYRRAALPALMPLSVGEASHGSEPPRYSALPSLMPLNTKGNLVGYRADREPDASRHRPSNHRSAFTIDHEIKRRGEEYQRKFEQEREEQRKKMEEFDKKWQEMEELERRERHKREVDEYWKKVFRGRKVF